MNGPLPAPNRRVLIVDDNRTIHDDFAKILLRADRGANVAAAAADLFGETAPQDFGIAFELTSAFQGQEALALVQDAVAAGRPFALAFVDVRMPPGWDGIETIDRIWRVQPDLQVIICTAYSDYSWDEMIARLGHSDRLVILKKPFDNLEALQLAVALTQKWNLEGRVRQHLDELESIVLRRTAQLRKSEEWFRVITENAAELVAIIDVDGRVQYRSPSYRTLLGYADADLHRGEAFADVDPEDRARITAILAETVASGARRVFEYRVRRQDGRWLTLEAQAAPFRNAVGIMQGVLMVARDITERRMLEVTLRQAQKLESIGQLAAGVAHEINTPTQFVGDNARFLRTAFAQLLEVLQAQQNLVRAAQAGAPSSAEVAAAAGAAQAADLEYLLREIPAAIDQSIEGIERVTKIVRALKDFSHPGSTRKVPVDLRQSIETTLTVCRNEWKYVADVTTDFDPALPPVPIIAGEFDQVILNLVINATHAIAEARAGEDAPRGTITIATRRTGAVAEIRISDTGCGIRAEIRDRIFDPFFTTKAVGKGTGQGLAIARAVVMEKHGGTIDFESEPGRGTTFIIRLPLAAAASAEAA